MMSGADVRYEMGTGDEHPLVGRWAPDLRLDTIDGSVRLAELTAGARPLLLDTTGSLGDALSGWRDRVQVVTGRADTSTTAMLLRPDGYTAWASNAARPDTRSLRKALTAWFGAATAEVSA